MTALKKVLVYTDGSCLKNPGPGGYGVVLESGLHTKELSNGYKNTTNNRMELLAVIAGLSALKFKCHVTIFTDSQYVKRGMTEWIESWKKRGWKLASGDPVKNDDLWRSLDLLCKEHEVEWQWVKGHNGHPQNERCDKLARDAASQDASKLSSDDLLP